MEGWGKYVIEHRGIFLSFFIFQYAPFIKMGTSDRTVGKNNLHTTL
jgi:hypothetical protein